MKTFKEWTAERQDSINHNLNNNSSYYDILAVIKQAVDYMQAHPDHPNVDLRLYGWVIRVWRRFINDEKIHIGYKPSWEKNNQAKDYYDMPAANITDLTEKIADMLYKYRGSNHS